MTQTMNDNIDLEGFSGVDSYTPDEQAEFRVGSNDVPAYWFSQANTPDGNTVSGLFIPVFRKDFDDAVEAYNEDRPEKQQIQRVTIIHDESNENATRKGQSNQKEYWQLPTPTIGDKDAFSISLLIICKGLKSPLHERGIVMAWGDKGTVLRFRCLIVELADYGFYEPLCISVGGLGKAKMGFLDGVLYEQVKVFTAFKAVTGKKDAVLPYYSFTLPLGKTKLVSVGKAHTKGMILPVALIPPEVTKAYLQQHWLQNTPVGNLLLDTVRTLLPETVEWATQVFSEIDTGNNKASAKVAENAPEDDAPMFNEYGEPVETRKASTTEASEPALPGQRDGLRRLGMSLQRTDLVELADSPDLTKVVAGQAILFAQQKNKK